MFYLLQIYDIFVFHNYAQDIERYRITAIIRDFFPKYLQCICYIFLGRFCAT